MKRFALAAAILAIAAVPALASEATFERNLTVNGHVELAVSTGSGTFTSPTVQATAFTSSAT